MRFKKTIPVSLGETEKRVSSGKNGKRTIYRSYTTKIGVVFTEDTRALYEILNRAKTLPELLREGLLLELGEDPKALARLKRQGNQSGTALAAMIKSLPAHVKNLRAQAEDLETWLIAHKKLSQAKNSA